MRERRFIHTFAPCGQVALTGEQRLSFTNVHAGVHGHLFHALISSQVVETLGDKIVELTLSFFFAVDLCMGLYVCDHRLWFWIKPDVVRGFGVGYAHALGHVGDVGLGLQPNYFFRRCRDCPP